MAELDSRPGVSGEAGGSTVLASNDARAEGIQLSEAGLVHRAIANVGKYDGTSSVGEVYVRNKKLLYCYLGLRRRLRRARGFRGSKVAVSVAVTRLPSAALG